MKTVESVKTAIETGVEWVVVEQDRMHNLTPMETALVSYLNLKEAECCVIRRNLSSILFNIPMRLHLLKHTF